MQGARARASCARRGGRLCGARRSSTARRDAMRITIVLPFVNLTGGIRVMLDYANCLHDAGHDVTVVYPRWPYQFQYTREQQQVEFEKHRQQGDRVPWFPLKCRVRCVRKICSWFLPRADIVIATAWPTV